MSQPSLREVALTEQTSMFKKLDTLTDEEWAELTAWMSQRFQAELTERGLGIYYKRDVDQMERDLERLARRRRP